jgi:hypothetical protein
MPESFHANIALLSAIVNTLTCYFRDSCYQAPLLTWAAKHPVGRRSGDGNIQIRNIGAS